MLTHSTRRWLAGLGVAGAFVAASASPAVAAEAPFEIATHDLLVAPGHTDYGYVYAQPTDTESELTFGRTSVDVDLSAVAGIATVEPAWGWTCDVSPTKLHCETDVEEGQSPWFDYMVTAKDDAKPGQKGSLAISITAGGKTAKATSAVTIAEGVDLASDPTTEGSGAPGGTAGLPAAVRNAGETPVDGAVLVIQAEYLAAYGGDFSNCKSDEWGMASFCKFDTKIEPNKAYKLSGNLPIKVAPEARTGASFPVVLDWWTTDDWELAFKDWFLDVKPGKGEQLRLVEQSVKSARVPQTDLDQSNDTTIGTVRVTGDNHADLSTKGATASGKKGDEVTVEPSFTNLGPATLEYLGQGTPGLRLEDLPVRVSVPADTTVVEAPFDCVPFAPEEEWDPWTAPWGEPGAKEYACQVLESWKDDDTSYSFLLRIDKVVPDAAGAITTSLTGDPNKSNDTAKIVINPTSPDGGNGGGGGDDNGDGDGGSLPITGQSTGLIAGLGALLLAAGVGGYLVAKRRRTRFVA
ncbi:LPXTG cell wall anchor domain-containing protein [Micromonospora sp. D93]|uniref:LPXTG cell wall anchor domain-containing protein n=1 Tax=Micromonospora sp. D93 TaxID=2824886 RepID=UPI001B36E312|nr:LPXTG cell wall anchor domain-containing protein [Micromonospora sp. D93]MBQ1019040.1 LPXTG cell wall anchor domain-containing protein [Micromonospora sp. D93]